MRIEAEADVDRGGAKPLRLYIVRDNGRYLPRRRSEIELKWNTPIEMHAVEGCLDRRFRGGQGIAVIADRPFEHQHRAARGVVQIVEDLLVGGIGIGKIDALHDAPSLASGAASDDGSVLRPRIERRDDDPVITGRAQRGDRRAFQRLFDERLPVSLLGWRKVARQE